MSGIGAWDSDNMWDHQFSWVLGWITTPGNKEIDVIPAGRYLMNVRPNSINTYGHDVLGQYRLGISSTVPLKA